MSNSDDRPTERKPAKAKATPKPKQSAAGRKFRRAITVRAGDGFTLFLPSRVAVAPGARPYRLEGDATVVVEGDDPFVLRCLRTGDLVMVKTP